MSSTPPKVCSSSQDRSGVTSSEATRGGHVGRVTREGSVHQEMEGSVWSCGHPALYTVHTTHRCHAPSLPLLHFQINFVHLLSHPYISSPPFFPLSSFLPPYSPFLLPLSSFLLPLLSSPKSLPSSLLHFTLILFGVEAIHSFSLVSLRHFFISSIIICMNSVSASHT